ncbi:MAG: hypothetical protein KDI60_18210, partial [Xanthomonadales bacterium]|nr:hypothetical protein [Xanthomonadales bacterium]
RRHLLTPSIGAICEHHAGYAELLSEWIEDYDVEQIWVSSLIGHSLDALRTGLPLRWMAHDYFPFWPALHRDFGDVGARFDAAELGQDLATLRGGAFTELDAHWWQSMAARTVELLRQASAEVIGPSRSVLGNLQRVAPGLATLPQRHIAHGTASWPDAAAARAELSAVDLKLHSAERLRLLVLGRINDAKGLHLLR